MAAGDGAIPEMLAEYQAEGAGNFTAVGVKELWNKKVKSEEDGSERSCSTCHQSDLTQQGKHYKTGKVIEPMALSVNPERYQEAKEIRKWFLRNCKWAWGRECTAQEKGNFLVYLKSQ
jgi:hypothetical protein